MGRIVSWFYEFLSTVTKIVPSISDSVQVDGYANFTNKADGTFAFTGAAGKVTLYSADDAMFVEFNEATNVNSMVVPKATVVERSGIITSISVKGTTTTGTLHISADMVSETKSDFELQSEMKGYKNL